MDVNALIVGIQAGQASAPPPDTQEKEITVTENGTTEVTPDEGKYLSKVTVTAEMKGDELNIAYGDTEPEDTSKLWVKTAAPSGPVKLITEIQTPAEYTDSTQNLSATLPSSMGGMAHALIGSKLYMFGGGSSNSGSTTAQYFDFEKQAFTSLPALPARCWGMSCAAVGTKIYLFGGTASTAWLSKAYCFDTEANELNELSASTAINYYSGVACAAVGTKIYLFGGRALGYTDTYNTIRCYDTESGEMQTLTEKLPVKSSFMGCAAVGTKIYLLGGHDGRNPQKSIYCFDTETRQTEELSATLPDALYLLSCVAVGSHIYATGGVYGSGSITGAIYTLDTVTNKVEKRGGSITYATHSVFVYYDGYFYAFGGCAGVNSFGPYTAKNIIRKVILAIPMPLPKGWLRILTHSTPGSTVATLVKGSAIEVTCGITRVYVGDEDNIGQITDWAVWRGSSWSTL